MHTSTLASAALLAALHRLSPSARAGCDTLRGTTAPDLPMWVHHPGGALAIELRRTLTSEARQTGELYERGQPEIDARHRRVFVGSSDHGLYALDAESGQVLWRYETTGSVQSEPLYDPVEDVVYFGSNDGALYKVRAVDGQTCCGAS